MPDRDIIIRASGNLDEIKSLLEEATLEIKALGVDCGDISIRQVPDKVSRKSLQNKKARDMKISVSGSPSSVEDFMDAVSNFIEKDLELSPPSTMLQLPKE